MDMVAGFVDRAAGVGAFGFFFRIYMLHVSICTTPMIISTFLTPKEDIYNKYLPILTLLYAPLKHVILLIILLPTSQAYIHQHFY
jgi:hypothetical protein